MESSQAQHEQSIKSQLEQLARLQALDLEMLERRRHIEGARKKMESEQSALSKAQSGVQHLRESLDKLLKDRRAAELSVKEKAEQIEKLGGQLYSVKTNDAYHALQSEIKQKKNENSSLEERVLEMMVGEDEMRAEILQAEKALNAEAGLARAGKAEEESHIQTLEKEIAEVKGRWDELARGVSPENLERYQRLRDAKGGLAVAKIENDICTGCRLTIRPQATIELKKYRALLTCDNCARILYAD